MNCEIPNAVIYTGLFMGGVSVFLAIFVAIITIIKFFRATPPNHLQFASKAEVDKLDRKLIQTETKLETQISSLDRKISEQYEKIERSDEARTSGLHKRMNTVAENVAGLTKEVEAFKSVTELLMKKLG